jgi:hypothetical protein
MPDWRHVQTQTEKNAKDCSTAARPGAVEVGRSEELGMESSQRSYDHAARGFIERYCTEPSLAFNKTVVTWYRIFLEQAHMHIRRLTSACRRFAALQMKPLMPVC